MVDVCFSFQALLFVVLAMVTVKFWMLYENQHNNRSRWHTKGPLNFQKLFGAGFVSHMRTRAAKPISYLLSGGCYVLVNHSVTCAGLCYRMIGAATGVLGTFACPPQNAPLASVAAACAGFFTTCKSTRKMPEGIWIGRESGLTIVSRVPSSKRQRHLLPPA